MINVVIAVENNEFYYAYITLLSLFENTKKRHNIFLLYGDVERYTYFVNLSEKYNQCIFLIANENEIESYESILNNYRTVFLDSHCIVNGEIEELLGQDDDVVVYSAEEIHKNEIPYDKIKNEMLILDFGDATPLESWHAHIELEKLWWDYAKKSDIYGEIRDVYMSNVFMEMQLERHVNDLKINIAGLKKNLEMLVQENTKYLEKI